MTKYKKLKLSYSLLNELKSGIVGTEETLNISFNILGHSNDETNFPQELF